MQQISAFKYNAIDQLEFDRLNSKTEMPFLVLVLAFIIYQNKTRKPYKQQMG